MLMKVQLQGSRIARPHRIMNALEKKKFVLSHRKAPGKRKAVLLSLSAQGHIELEEKKWGDRR